MRDLKADSANSYDDIIKPCKALRENTSQSIKKNLKNT